MEKEVIIQKTIDFVKETLYKAEGGHDYWHIIRVYNLAKTIASNEKGTDIFIVEIGALLHDIADSKFHNGDEEIGPKKARDFLESLNIEKEIIQHVENIIKYISFSKSFENTKFNSLELQIIQDADRLEALGAIGIARAFTFGGFKGNELYNPKIKPNLNKTKEEYKSKNGTTINHFYEKLLLLKDKMNTKTGKKIAEKRHEYMENFLKQFFDEWNGLI